MISENSRFKLSRSTEMIAHKTWITRSPRFHFNFLGKNSGRGISVPKSLIFITLLQISIFCSQNQLFLNFRSKNWLFWGKLKSRVFRENSLIQEFWRKISNMCKNKVSSKLNFWIKFDSSPVFTHCVEMQSLVQNPIFLLYFFPSQNSSSAKARKWQ